MNETSLVQHGLGAQYSRILIGDTVLIATNVEIYHHYDQSSMEIRYRNPGGHFLEMDLTLCSRGFSMEEAVKNMKTVLDSIVGGPKS